ncbi:hypothetical protein ADL19_19670 [Streptomyces purpurogeneiscleroticus]|nr:hypothetical protein ADL19_19670 [Streptomyces purpurogeneiscleroticus]
MTDLVAMKAKTTFHNTRVQNDKGGLVETGDTFETDVMHAKDLQRLGHADPVDGSLDGREDAPLEPHHQVSERALVADRAKRGSGAARRDRDRTDGPTVEEYVASGYRAENYPPEGYVSRSTPEEIAAAVAAQAGK